MMRRFSAVLLDVDGTLVDSNDAHTHAWLEVFAAHGHEVAYLRIRRMIGMGGDRVIEEVMGLPRGSKENERISHERSELFREKWLRAVRPLQGSRKLVLRLRSEQYQFAIASAAKADELEPLLEIADIADLVTVRTTSSEVEQSKPDPEILEKALGKLDAERSRTVMIGDTPYDVLAARRANIACIGLTSGGWPAADLAGTYAIAADPAALADALPI